MIAMEEAAEDDPELKTRVMHYRYRSLEELYDLENDPGCLVNLAESPEYRGVLDSLRGTMEESMKESGDPLLRAYRNRDDSKIVEDVFNEVYPDRVSVVSKKEWERY